MERQLSTEIAYGFVWKTLFCYCARERFASLHAATKCLFIYAFVMRELHQTADLSFLLEPFWVKAK